MPRPWAKPSTVFCAHQHPDRRSPLNQRPVRDPHARKSGPVKPGCAFSPVERGRRAARFGLEQRSRATWGDLITLLNYVLHVPLKAANQGLALSIRTFKNDP